MWALQMVYILEMFLHKTSSNIHVTCFPVCFKGLIVGLCLHRNTLRLTRSAALSSQDGAVGGSVYLGKKGKDFEFSQLANRVEFIECSAHGSKGEDGDAEIDALEKCLARI